MSEFNPLIKSADGLPFAPAPLASIPSHLSEFVLAEPCLVERSGYLPILSRSPCQPDAYFHPVALAQVDDLPFDL